MKSSILVPNQVRYSLLGLLISEARLDTFEGTNLIASSTHTVANFSGFVSSYLLQEALGLLHLLMKLRHSLELSLISREVYI